MKPISSCDRIEFSEILDVINADMQQNIEPPPPDYSQMTDSMMGMYAPNKHIANQPRQPLVPVEMNNMAHNVVQPMCFPMKNFSPMPMPTQASPQMHYQAPNNIDNRVQQRMQRVQQSSQNDMHMNMQAGSVVQQNMPLVHPSMPVIGIPRNTQLDMPYIEIVEQPASRAMRFRYQCEGRPAGNIPGVHSTPEKRTFPAIKVNNYTGKVMIVVSCVTENAPYRTHPHKITSKEYSRNGIICLTVNGGEIVRFSSLGIQCAKKKDVVQCIEEREASKVDPFNTGYDHKYRPTTIDLNAVRLAFQGFIKLGPKNVITLDPVVSDVIYDKKSMYDLVIIKMSHYSASVAGGTEMILLCEKVSKDDIQIRFFEEVNGELLWEGLASFSSSDVHKQAAIAFRTPRYKNQEIQNSVKVFVELRRPSDGAISSPVEFELLPVITSADSSWDLQRCKRYKPNDMENPRSDLRLSDVLPKGIDLLPYAEMGMIQSNTSYNFYKPQQVMQQQQELAKKIPKTIQISPQFGFQYSNQRNVLQNMPYINNISNNNIQREYDNLQHCNFDTSMTAQGNMQGTRMPYFGDNQTLNQQPLINYQQSSHANEVNQKSYPSFLDSESQLVSTINFKDGSEVVDDILYHFNSMEKDKLFPNVN